jgi:predicted MFS family arabinose efflux permease
MPSAQPSCAERPQPTTAMRTSVAALESPARPGAQPALTHPNLARGRATTGMFAAVSAVLVLFMTAAGAPSPLYVVYQRAWGFSATTLTVVFAVYVAGLMAALLVLGALSDHVGRRPVLAAAITLEAAAMVLFLVAGDVWVLLLARIVQGIATGAAITTLGATLVDMNPPHAPGRAGLVSSVASVSGLALGALGSGALIQFAPAPMRLVFVLLLAGLVLAAIVVALMPETSARRPGARASLAPRLGVPSRLRRDVYALVPMLVASWALGGLYLSLGPSVAASVFGLSSHLIEGLVVTVLCGTGAVSAFALRRRPVGRLLSIAAILLAAGTVLTLGGVEAHSILLAALGTAVAGVGFGAGLLACFGTLARLAGPGERGELFSVAYVIAYLAFSVPAVFAGVAAVSTGLRATTLVYGVGVAALSLAALAGQRLTQQQRASHPLGG